MHVLIYVFLYGYLTHTSIIPDDYSKDDEMVTKI